MSFYAIARIYVIEADCARDAYEEFPERVRRETEHEEPEAEYQSNCFPITREQATDPNWHVERIFYANEPIEPIPADEEDER